MPIDPGLGGSFTPARPVPIDSTLLGQRPYIPPVSSGEPAQAIPQPVPQVEPLPTYSSVPRVVQAYLQGVLSYNQAYDILVTQFGFSGLDATDALGVESATIVAEQDLTPPAVSKPEVIATDDTPAAAAPAAPQDFMLVGLAAVVGAVWLFFGKG